jgi:hypothetical protein
MSTALTAFHSAFLLSTSALQRLGVDSQGEPETSHSLWSHWPVVTAGTTCLITTINAVALGVIGNISLGVLLGIASIGAGILTFYLWSFSSLKDLNEYVEVFAKKVTLLDKQNQELLERKKQADEMAQGLYTQFIQIAELLVSLKKQKEEVEAVLCSLQSVDSSLATHTAQLHHVAEDLQKGAFDAQNFVDTLKPFEGLGEYIKQQMEGSTSSPHKK